MDNAPAIFVDSISKSYGNMKALENVSLAIKKGEVFGLIGPNGAGKSTLSKIITGMLKQDSGVVFINGIELAKNFSKIKSYMAIVPQDVSFFMDFSVEENISFFATLYGLDANTARQRTDYLINWLYLEKFKNIKAKNLSGGYKRLLNIACSLVNDPQIIIMDEPTVGLDPKVRQIFWEKITYLKEQGKTICLTTHYMDEAQHLCNTIGLISNGKLLVNGTPFDLIQKYGGVKVLVVGLDKVATESDFESLKGILQGTESEIAQSGTFLIISVPNEKALQKISAITEWLVGKEYQILSSQLKEPDLEDVFMTVAGERLRE
jgi:ABC-2 type transport system ATP-binding protein